MRISASKDDPVGYANFKKAGDKRIDIYLDGVLMDLVETADSTEGWIIKAKADKDGSILLEGDEVVRERRNGKVEIVIGEKL